MTKEYIKQFIEHSDSNPSLTYTVSKTKDGQWECSCRGWTGHYPRKDCKHILRVKNRLKKSKNK